MFFKIYGIEYIFNLIYMFIYRKILFWYMTTFHTIVLGNSHTVFDAEQIVGLLEEAKFEFVADVEKTDVIIFSVCLVEEEKEQDFFYEFEKLRAQFPYKMIVVAGCLDHVQIGKLKGQAMVSSRKIHHIVEVVEELVHENVITYLQRDEMPSLLLPRKKKEEYKVVVPVMRGCYDLFAFLSKRKGTRQMVSYPVEEIVEFVRREVALGIHEIVLSAIDVAEYGKDIGKSLLLLLRELNELQGEFRIVLERMSVGSLKEIYAELFPLFEGGKLCSYLYVPVYAGSTRILQRCGFSYTIDDFSLVMNEFRGKVGLGVIKTALLVGFPDENEQDHWETLSMLRKVVPDEMAISLISRKEMSVEEREALQRRAKVFYEVFQNGMILRNERWWGKEVEVLIESQRGEREFAGLTRAGKEVIVEEECKIGEIFLVRIKLGGKMELRGQIVKK